MTETLNIPLNKLVAWDGNVRRTGIADGIEELAASIAAHGLLQAPVVRKGKSGKYAVIAGRRRLTALRLLAERGTVAPDMPVPCQRVENTADAGEISLAENVVRIAMHPADQFEAFRDLVDRGMDSAAIAARFGVSESVVTKRLKLGRLSPVILEAYRNGDIDLEAAQAFAIVDDHAAQERVLAAIPDWQRNPVVIRHHLTEGEISATDRRVRFVGLEAYEQAGGVVRRDLFDDKHGGTILDAALLDRLVQDKLTALADSVRAEGWAWVEIAPVFDRTILAGFTREHPARIEPTDEQKAQHEALAAEFDELADSPEADDGDDAVLARLEEIERQMDAIEESLVVWSPETLGMAGAIVTIGYGGEARIERGLVRRGDEPEPQEREHASARQPAGIPAALIADLTAQKTAALQVALAQNPGVALAAAVHALALPGCYTASYGQTCLQLTLREALPDRYMADPDSVRAPTVNENARTGWMRQLPEQPDELWAWCLAQSPDTLLSLLGFLIAQSVNAVQMKGDRPDSDRLVHADALARTLELDMAAWFTPTAENYFSRISSAQIVAALCDAKGGSPAPSWAKMKKAELAAFAAREVAGTGWLPEALRAHAVAPDSDTGQAA